MAHGCCSAPRPAAGSLQMIRACSPMWQTTVSQPQSVACIARSAKSRRPQAQGSSSERQGGRDTWPALKSLEGERGAEWRKREAEWLALAEQWKKETAALVDQRDGLKQELVAIRREIRSVQLPKEGRDEGVAELSMVDQEEGTYEEARDPLYRLEKVERVDKIDGNPSRTNLTEAQDISESYDRDEYKKPDLLLSQGPSEADGDAGVSAAREIEGQQMLGIEVVSDKLSRHRRLRKFDATQYVMNALRTQHMRAWLKRREIEE